MPKYFWLLCILHLLMNSVEIPDNYYPSYVEPDLEYFLKPASTGQFYLASFLIICNACRNICRTFSVVSIEWKWDPTIAIFSLKAVWFFPIHFFLEVNTRSMHILAGHRCSASKPLQIVDFQSGMLSAESICTVRYKAKTKHIQLTSI